MKLAILTPTRNRLGFLQQNIASVRMSSTAPLELEIIQAVHDCGSDDGTREYLQGLDDPRLVLSFSPGRTAPGRARNLAAASCESDLLMPLDDDDLLLQRTAYHFAKSLEAGIARWAVADFLKIDQDGRYLAGEDYYGWDFSSADEMLRAVFSGRHFIQGNVCFTRELFDAVGSYEEMETAEDLELYTRFILEAGLPLYVPTVSHLHRMHGGNVSRQVDKDRYNRDLAEIYEKHRTSLEKRGIPLEPIP
ncbi:glycosyltransferase [Haloferula sp. BvORR071]|uniref:glycosyltransferase family 2 protein n=1 Tax=Haloferula sp. BvORR071 TaxID=1396141 RepID=UPI00054F4A51|nr:glycosyltransferase [Haloferula sp. BvORR071]